MKTPKKHGSGSRLPTDVDRLVGDNVRRLRTQREQTLTGLSVELGISHQQLQKYETGSNRLSAGMIARLSEVFGVPVTALFQKPGISSRDMPTSSPEGWMLCEERLLCSLTVRAQKIL